MYGRHQVATSLAQGRVGRMTIGIERMYAIRNTRQFLMDLRDPKKTPRVPREIRKMAHRLLRHYPGEFYMEETQKLAPDIWGPDL